MGRRTRMSVQEVSQAACTEQKFPEQETAPIIWRGGSSSGNQRSPSNNSSGSTNRDKQQEVQPKKRGKTVLKKIWNSAIRVDVVANSRGQPIGYDSLRLSGFIGVVVRSHCPMNYKTWHKVLTPTKQSLVDTIRTKFKMPSTITCWLRKTISKKFRY